MNGKSAEVVRFLANLMPLYGGEKHDDIWCARSMQDGTLIAPVDESEWDEERGRVGVRWHGDPTRECEVEGELLVAVALERYVRLHGVGNTEEAIAAELWYMARHFHIKTGCTAYLPQLSEPPSSWTQARRTAAEFGKGILVNLMSKPFGA